MSKKIPETYQKTSRAYTTFNIIKRELLRDKLALVSFIFIATLIIFVIIASLGIDPIDLLLGNFDMMNQPPSIYHFLGTDDRGRDGLMLLIIATRNSLITAMLATFISSTIGVIYGLISGYVGGRIDNLMMRITEGISMLPSIILLIAFVAVVGELTIFTFTVLISLLSWTGVAKVVRATLMKEKELEYIQASKTVGTPHLKIILQQILPNLSTVIVAGMTLNIVGIMGVETGLSFIGFGFPIYTPSLGTLIATARFIHVLTNRWWIWIPATLLIVFITFSINNIGNMLNRATDARQRRG